MKDNPPPTTDSAAENFRPAAVSFISASHTRSPMRRVAAGWSPRLAAMTAALTAGGVLVDVASACSKSIKFSKVHRGESLAIGVNGLTFFGDLFAEQRDELGIHPCERRVEAVRFVEFAD